MWPKIDEMCKLLPQKSAYSAHGMGTSLGKLLSLFPYSKHFPFEVHTLHVSMGVSSNLMLAGEKKKDPKSHDAIVIPLGIQAIL